MTHIHSETINHKGHKIEIKWFHDENMGPPWEEHDGHGPVSDWTTRDKRPGERVLHSDRSSHRYYDFAAAIKLAKKDGWDAQPYGTGTKGEQAVRAVEWDFNWLQRWCQDDWHWAGYQVTVDGEGLDSLWGTDSDSIADYTKTALAEAVEWLDKELAESERAACSDIITV